MSKENTQLGISNGPKNTLKLFSQDAFFFEANQKQKQKYKSTIKFVLTDRVKSDLRVSEQPDTAENSETKVKRWLIGRDHGKSTYDDNLVKSMTISSMNICLYSPRTKTKVFM